MATKNTRPLLAESKATPPCLDAHGPDVFWEWISGKIGLSGPLRLRIASDLA